MYFRFLHPPDALQQQTRMHRSPVRTSLTAFVSLFTSFLGFSLPVSAENINLNSWYKLVHPESETLLRGETKIRLFNSSDPLGRVSIPVLSPKRGMDGKQSNNKGNPDQKQALTDLQWLKWINYSIFLFLLLLLFWLSYITLLVSQDFASINRKYKRLDNDLSVLKKDLINTGDIPNKQASAVDKTNYHVEELAKNLSAHANAISSLSQNLRVLDNRFLAFQASHHVQLETLSQAPSPTPVQVEALKPMHKEQTIDDLVASVVEEYQAAFFRGDRSALRSITSDQLNITQNSEDSLMKTSTLPTQLEAVQNGGSYRLIHINNQHWLVPEFQILASFTANQLAKGIFTYDRENISAAELRWPAEVREVGGLWEVIAMGVIAVPS